MARYFLEVAYKGTQYSGFQVQENADTIQSEVEKAFQTVHRRPVQLTGSSRTDAGVHAIQNFFHFDFESAMHPEAVYKLNAILPRDIVVRNIYDMPSEAHSRFDALSRKYVYKIHRFKNPFLKDASLYYPYKLNMEALHEGAMFIQSQTNFFAFSKTNTQVKNFTCAVSQSEWQIKDEELAYKIEANRFLRGMVRLITATLLKLGRGKIAFSNFKSLFEEGAKCGFSIPPHGLYLQKVVYPETFSCAATAFHRVLATIFWNRLERIVDGTYLCNRFLKVVHKGKKLRGKFLRVLEIIFQINFLVIK